MYLPMFPLGNPLFPATVLRLRVFEPRYRAMARDVLAGDGRFGVALITRGHEVGGGDTRVDTGCVAQVVEAQPQSGGRWALGTVGTARIRVLEWLPDDPYPRAVVEEIEEPPPGPEDEAGRGRTLVQLAQTLALAAELGSQAPDATVLDQVADDPARAAFQIAALAPLGAWDRQRILEASTTAERYLLLDELLADAEEFFRLRLANPG